MSSGPIVSVPVAGGSAKLVTAGTPQVIRLTVPGPPGPPGPRGPQGVPGDNRALTTGIIAGADLGGHRVVRGTPGGLVFHSSSDMPCELGMALGITPGAIAKGQEGVAVIFGEMIEPSWNWRMGPIFLGLDGMLTQDSASTGFDQQVAFAYSPTRIRVEILAPVILAN